LTTPPEYTVHVTTGPGAATEAQLDALLAHLQGLERLAGPVLTWLPTGAVELVCQARASNALEAVLSAWHALWAAAAAARGDAPGDMGVVAVAVDAAPYPPPVQAATGQ
jgi:hypothetical protein